MLTTAIAPIDEVGPTRCASPSMATPASPAMLALSMTMSAISASFRPEGCRDDVARLWSRDVTATTGRPIALAYSATSITTPLMPVLEKMRNASPGWSFTCCRMTLPNPSTFSRNIAWRRPFGPTTPTWLEIASSAIGWKPGKLPIRGNISSVFIREWPEPNTWTSPSAAMVRANSSAARSIGSSWVASMRSRTARASASQRRSAVGRSVSVMRASGGGTASGAGERRWSCVDEQRCRDRLGRRRATAVIGGRDVLGAPGQGSRTRRSRRNRERSPRSTRWESSTMAPVWSCDTRRISIAGVCRGTPSVAASCAVTMTGSSDSVAVSTVRPWSSRRMSYSDRCAKSADFEPGQERRRQVGRLEQQRLGAGGAEALEVDDRIPGPHAEVVGHGLPGIDQPGREHRRRQGETQRPEGGPDREEAVHRRVHTGPGTNVPRPWCLEIRPRASSSASAWRSVARLTSSCSHSSRSGGRRVPGRHAPDRMRSSARLAMIEWSGSRVGVEAPIGGTIPPNGLIGMTAAGRQARSPAICHASALCSRSRSGWILALREGLEARAARLADQHGVLAQPGRPLRWAAGLIALFAIAACLLAYSSYTSQSGRVIDEAELRARGAAADVDRYVRERHQTLNAIAGMPAIVAGDPDQIRPVLVDLADRELGFDAIISWIDTERARPGPQRRRHRPPDRRQRPPAHPGRAGGKPAVSSGVIGAVNQAPVIAFVVPTYGADGRRQRRGRERDPPRARRATPPRVSGSPAAPTWSSSTRPAR